MGNPGNSTVSPPKSSQVRLESLGLLLLSLATVGTAWCSYQATTWGAAAQRLVNRSVAESREAARDQLHAAQNGVLDVMLFSQFVNARSSSNEALAKFYANRFRDDAKVAFEAWLATQPFEDEASPTHPFSTNFYQPKLLSDAAAGEVEAAKLLQQSAEAGRISRAYVLVTVLLATALFCGGTASKFDTNWIRRSALGLGLAAFCFALARMVVLPVQL